MKILLIRLDNIGDVIVTTPAIQALRRQFPHSKIDILIRKDTEPVIHTNPDVSEILITTPPWLHRSGKRKLFESIPFYFSPIVRQLRRSQYTIVIDFHADPRNIILAYLIHAPIRISHPERGLGFLLTHPIPLDATTHIIARHLSLLAPLGITHSPQTTLIHISKQADEKIKKILHTEKIGSYFCLNPGTGRINKFWQNDYWAALGDQLFLKYGVAIVYTGGPDDAAMITEIQQKMKHETHSFAGRLTLEESAALISHAKLFVSTDTGPMHIAHAVHTPQVALFGPVNPAMWGYHDMRSEVVYKKLPCSFCDQPDCIRKTKRYACMTEIMPAQVLNAITRVLKK